MPRWLLVLVDLGFLVTFLALVGTPVAAVAVALDALGPTLGLARWALLPVAPLVVLLVVLAVAALVHRLLPAARPCVHAVPSAAAVGWLVRFWLQRVVFFAPWRELVLGSVILRGLALRALGGRAPITAMMSSDVALGEVYLLRLGPGSMLGTGVSAIGHLFVGERLVLGEVTVGAGAQVYAEAALAPGVTIGERAIVGARASIGPNTDVGAGARIGLGVVCVRDVRIGAGARVGAAAVLLPGAVVPAGAEVAPGAVVGPESA